MIKKSQTWFLGEPGFSFTLYLWKYEFVFSFTWGVLWPSRYSSLSAIRWNHSVLTAWTGPAGAGLGCWEVPTGAITEIFWEPHWNQNSWNVSISMAGKQLGKDFEGSYFGFEDRRCSLKASESSYWDLTKTCLRSHRQISGRELGWGFSVQTSTSDRGKINTAFCR